MSRSVIVIGAGIGGLSAGCYAKMNGFDVKVFEMGATPGGMCASWKRKGYMFDGSIHHLAGTAEGTPLNAMWKNLGAFPAEIVYPEELVTVKDAEGRALTVYYDAERLAEELKRFAPGDAEKIEAYVRFSQEFENIDFLEMGFWKWTDWVARLPKMMRIMKRGKIAMAEYAKNFDDPFLRKFFPTFQYDWTETPLMLHLNILTGSRKKRYGWYPGGSLAFSTAIAHRLTALGGEIHYRSEVEKILVKDDRAIGVQLKSGESLYADAVISNATGYTTTVKFLESKYLTQAQRDTYAQPQEETKMGIHVSYGVNRDLSAEPHAMTLFTKQPFEITGIRHDRVKVENFAFDPRMAPKGKASIKAIYNTRYAYWEKLAENPDRYREEKEKIAQITLEQLETFYPGIKSQIEVTDVATPLTTERYTGNGRGYGDVSEINPKEMMRMMMNKPLSLTGLKSCYLIGQSVGGAGIPGCAGMGRNAVKALCKESGMKFRERTG
ncbi:MAG TPA: NAD(P)/FAD-dependent oxidoreductase [Thermotogota bacterium]|nr:NAD(P)/FAD-dependent oxidoreductase [Thermotogota bacterium]